MTWIPKWSLALSISLRSVEKNPTQTFVSVRLFSHEIILGTFEMSEAALSPVF